MLKFILFFPVILFITVIERLICLVLIIIVPINTVDEILGDLVHSLSNILYFSFTGKVLEKQEKIDYDLFEEE